VVRIDVPRMEGRILKLVELVNLCGKDEIALRKTVDFVRPARDLDFPPSKEDVWVVALLFGELTHAVYELESLTKVRKLKALGRVVFFDDVPATCPCNATSSSPLSGGTPPRHGTHVLAASPAMDGSSFSNSRTHFKAQLQRPANDVNEPRTIEQNVAHTAD
jgi:hypothetical protein